MNKSLKTTISIFGAISAVAGIEHGVGEIMQGSIAPQNIFILSWPHNEFFRILAGEPAMTLIPNYLITGVLAIIFSTIFFIWVAFFIHRRFDSLILILLSIIMLLTGAGFGPPILGIILGIAGTKVNSTLKWWRIHGRIRSAFQALWPYNLIAGVVAWLFVFPGINFLSYFFKVENDTLTYTVIFLALGLLILALISSLANDAQEEAE